RLLGPGEEHDGEAGNARGDHLPVAIVDRPARSGNDHRPQTVVLGCEGVGLSPHDLRVVERGEEHSDHEADREQSAQGPALAAIWLEEPHGWMLLNGPKRSALSGRDVEQGIFRLRETLLFTFTA